METHPPLIQLVLAAQTGNDQAFKHIAKRNPDTVVRLLGLAEHRLDNGLCTFTEDGKVFAIPYNTAKRIIDNIADSHE